MSKRLRLKRYSRKIVSCTMCPMNHPGPVDGVTICKAGMYPIWIGPAEALGLPAECPLEEHDTKTL